MCVSGDAIGIFDSGVGGLTVLRQVTERLPGESIIYLGDTARVPYGTKSADTVIRYARACARMLMARGIKVLVVACNTASAFAIDALRDELDIPVLDVIDPGSADAVRKTRNGRIGVIGTSGTVTSGAYPDAILARNDSLRVCAQACPLFVPLAEEGWVQGDVPRMVAQRYLETLLAENIDTLVLGCTHYPLLKSTIAEVAGPDVVLVDSAEATAQVVVETLEAFDATAPQGTEARHTYLVSDAPDNFARIGRRFLGYDIGGVEWVDF